MSGHLIVINLFVVVVAVTGMIYFLKIVRLTSGPIRKSVVFLTLGYSMMMLEHFVLAYLRRSHTPLESSAWFMLFPLYIAAIIFFLAGVYKLQSIFKGLVFQNKRVEK